MFPGLTYRMLEPKLVLLIFTSGKIVFAGAKKRIDVYKAYQQIYPYLIKFKKRNPSNIAPPIEKIKRPKTNKVKKPKQK